MSNSSTIFLSITSLIYITILVVVYFVKKRVNSIENKIFTKLLIINLVSLISELYITLIPINIDIPLFVISLKLYLILCVMWLSYFMEYVFVITRNRDDKKSIDFKQEYNKIYIIYWIITILVIGSIIILPIHFYNELGMKYSYGESVNVVFGLSAFYTIVMFYYIVRNVKNIKNKGYIPIIFLVILLTVVAIIQKINPSLLLANTCFSIITSLMYFTIENPDIKMMKDLAFANELVEESKNRTLGVLNDLSKDLQGSLSKLQTFGYKKVNYKDNEEVTDELKYIKNYCIGFVDRVSGLIEIGKLESGILEEKSRNYETLELFSEIEKLFNYEKGHKKINLFIDFDKDVPMVLYGNSSKIKQLILVLFEYLVKYIKNGNLEIRIEAINVGRFCKLKFHFINYNINSKIFDNVDDIFNKKINRLISFTSSDIDIINNELVLSFNERIIDPYLLLEEDKENKGINVKYFDMSKRNILIVSNNNSNLKKILLLLKPYNSNIDVVNSFYEFRDILSDNKTYDLILIDEEINDIESNIRLLKKFANYTLNVVIMTSEMDKNSLNNYLENGYDDYIIKPINKQNINNILVKIIKNK